MRWVWDEEKNRSNKRDHGLSFETAQLVFNDPLALSRADPHPDGDPATWHERKAYEEDGTL